MNEKKVRLSGIAYESLVNGPGLRRVLFAQGCRHNCEGCFNPDTHSMSGGKLVDMDEIVESIKGNPMLSGVTFSGGDPFEQADKFAYIAGKLKESDMNIWCYTGYVYEYLIEHQSEHAGWSELLQNIDVLIDGEFDESKKDPAINYRGSTNQRIIDIKNSSYGNVKCLDL